MKEKKNARQNDTSLNIICVDNYFATFAYCNIETKKYNYKLHFINENVIYRQCFIIKLIEWNIFFFRSDGKEIKCLPTHHPKYYLAENVHIIFQISVQIIFREKRLNLF